MKTTKHFTLLFLIQDDQVLLAMKKRGFGEGKYNGVGGKIEEGEDIEVAAIRETQEEIGVTPIAPVKAAHLTFHTEGDEATALACHVFVAYDWEGHPQETEEMAPEWFYADMIPYERMWPDDIHWLPLILQGHTVIGEFTFNDAEEIVKQSIDLIEPEQLP